MPDTLVAPHHQAAVIQRPPAASVPQVMYWVFGAIWISFFFVWAASTFSPGKRRKGLRAFLFLLPLAQFGNCVIQVHTYTVCPCLYCSGVHSYTGYKSLIAARHTLDIIRLVVFPLCLYVIATGCGTIHPRLPLRGWMVLLFVGGGLIAALACATSEEVDAYAAYVGSIVMYLFVLVVIIAEAVLSCKVLKAQLLMIRQQNIDPRTCPAWSKFRLFTRLRRNVAFFFLLYVALSFTQLLSMPWEWTPIFFMIWEGMQVTLSGALGWVFGGTNFNYFLENERHLQPGEVSQALLVSDMTLEWDEDDLAIPTDGEGALASWHEPVLVPAPPEAPPLISVLQSGRTQNRAAVERARAARTAAAAASPTRPAADEVQRDAGAAATQDGIAMGAVDSTHAAAGPV